MESVVNQMESAVYSINPLSLLVLMVVIYVAAYAITDAIAMSRDKRAKKLRKSTPVIGYKMAHFNGFSNHSLPFCGVTGHEYGVVDRADGMSDVRNFGFHMYSTYDKAEKHPQAGNVLLEVVGYGDIYEWTLGYTTSNQRVTQLIVGMCSDLVCENPVAGWDNSGKRWLCTACKSFRDVRDWMTFEDIERKLEEQGGVYVAVRSAPHEYPEVSVEPDPLKEVRGRLGFLNKVVDKVVPLPKSIELLRAEPFVPLNELVSNKS